MQKQEIITALGLLSLLMTMVHLKNEPPLPHQVFSEPEIEFSEFEIQENVKNVNRKQYWRLLVQKKGSPKFLFVRWLIDCYIYK